LETFLDRSAAQFTRRGLLDARDAVKERELAVFFRNNHFCVVFRLNGALYSLVTDQGYLSEPDVVWETLCEAERFSPGNAAEGTFADSNFAPFAPHADPAGESSQDEDDARLAAALAASAAESANQETAAGEASFQGVARFHAEDPEGAADADHALAVALQAEYEEERAREETASRARREAAARAEETAAPPRPPPPRRSSASGSRRLPPRSKKSSYSSECAVM
jgi:hypothetical protein